MSKHTTYKSSSSGKQETIARNQQRARKAGRPLDLDVLKSDLDRQQARRVVLARSITDQP